MQVSGGGGLQAEECLMINNEVKSSFIPLVNGNIAVDIFNYLNNNNNK